MSIASLKSGRVVIVGAGHAGTEAAFALRLGGLSGPIELLNAEDALPYQRPPLSKAFLHEGTSTPLRSRDAFAAAQIDMVSAHAIEIDSKRRALKLTDGTALTYDHLILAVGAQPNCLPIAKGIPVANLNDLQSAERLRRSLPSARRILIVGAGFIGMEFAAAATALGKEVVVIDRAARVLERATTPAISRYLENQHRSRGTQLFLDVDVAGIEHDEADGYAVSLSNGQRLHADVLVEAVGVTPRLGLARQAGLRTERGIIVGSTLVTSDSCISAIGDCVQFPHSTAGAMVLTSVQNSVDQAKHVAKRLSGTASVPYFAVPWFWSDQSDDKLQIVGLVPSVPSHVARRSSSDRSFSIFSFKDGSLASVETMNAPSEHLVARRIMNAQIPILPHQAADPKFELSSLLRRHC